MRKKIAYLIDGDLNNRKGLVNETISRLSMLKSISDYDIDVYDFQSYFGLIPQFFRTHKLSRIKREKVIKINGITFNLLWRKELLINYLLSVKFHLREIGKRAYLKKKSELLKNYDLISAHSLQCSMAAYYAFKKYGIPYASSWYGSDINVVPFVSSSARNDTQLAMNNASINFMCSKALWKTSDLIAPAANKTVLYNGLREGIIKFDDEKRNELRGKYNVKNNKVVAFAGGLVEIKNVLLLPDIFKEVISKYSGSVVFWVIGDGKLKDKISNKAKQFNIHIDFKGFVPDAEMVEMLNCIDVLVLPSKNEGLPLITIEALASGANVVGSDVGGIAEAIGFDNVFKLGEGFVCNISDRIVYMLSNSVKQSISEDFYCENIAKLENDIYKQILNIM